MDFLFRFIVWFSYLHAAQKDIIFIIFITPKARMQTGAWYIGWTWVHSVRSGWLLWTLRLIQTMEKVMQGRSTAARVCGGIRNLWLVLGKNIITDIFVATSWNAQHIPWRNYFFYLTKQPVLRREKKVEEMLTRKEWCAASAPSWKVRHARGTKPFRRPASFYYQTQQSPSR